MKKRTALDKKVRAAILVDGRHLEWAVPCYQLLFNGIEYRADDTADLVKLVVDRELKREDKP